FNELSMRFAFPCLGDELLGRIRPRVGIVKVQEEMKTQLLGCLGERQCIGKVVRKVLRGVKEPQPDPVVAVIPKDLQTWLASAMVLKDDSLSFGLLKDH